MIVHLCPNCGTFIEVPDQMAGKTGTCNVCGEPLTIPSWESPRPSQDWRGNLYVAGLVGIIVVSAIIVLLNSGIRFPDMTFWRSSPSDERSGEQEGPRTISPLSKEILAARGVEVQQPSVPVTSPNVTVPSSVATLIQSVTATTVDYAEFVTDAKYADVREMVDKLIVADPDGTFMALTVVFETSMLPEFRLRKGFLIGDGEPEDDAYAGWSKFKALANSRPCWMLLPSIFSTADASQTSSPWYIRAGSQTGSTGMGYTMLQRKSNALLGRGSTLGMGMGSLAAIEMGYSPVGRYDCVVFVPSTAGVFEVFISRLLVASVQVR